MITEGQAEQARKVIREFENQQKQDNIDREQADKAALAAKLAILGENTAVRRFLLTISEKEHLASSVTCLPSEEHIRRIQKRNLDLLMQAANQIAFYYNVDPEAFLKMMAELPFKDETSFNYRSWYDKLREHQKSDLKSNEEIC